MNTIDTSKFPKDLGYRYTGEWEEHEATWLSWPHKEESWPDRIQLIYPAYAEFIAELSKGEKVRINVKDEEMKAFALSFIEKTDADLTQVEFYFNETNDAWCRDHGPAFLLNKNNPDNPKVIVDWGFNAWGGKYPPFENDDVVDIWKEAFAHQADAICITEKDAVKLSQLHAIEDLKIPILVLSIGIEFISGKQEFIENLEI